jgi:hypothetical protein
MFEVTEMLRMDLSAIALSSLKAIANRTTSEPLPALMNCVNFFNLFLQVAQIVKQSSMNGLPISPGLHCSRFNRNSIAILN